MIHTAKAQQRRIAYDARNAQLDKERLSELICARFIEQTAYREALTVMWYLHCRSEVRTHGTVRSQLAAGKRVVIPYCTQGEDGTNQLGLWLLEDFDELKPGMWGILEPPRERWSEPGKEVSPDELDLIMVPGVAFDKNGGRLGNGAGYYDRLLRRIGSDTILTAVCFEAQILPKIIMEAHDVYMDYVITEKATYRCEAKV